MSKLNYSLENYTWKKAFKLGVMADHAKKIVAKEGKLGVRIVHALITAVHLIPVIGQITQIAEAIIVTKYRDKDMQLGFEEAKEASAQKFFQRGTFKLYGSMLSKPMGLDEALIDFQKAADLNHPGAQIQMALHDKKQRHLMQKAAEQNHPIALRFQQVELGLCRAYDWEGTVRNYLNFNDDLSDKEMTSKEFFEKLDQKKADIKGKLQQFPDTFPNDIYTQKLLENELRKPEDRWIQPIIIFGSIDLRDSPL